MPLIMESSGTSPKTDLRIIEAQDWLSRKYSFVSQDWIPVAGDASNRRYFRVRVDDTIYVVMDAPPGKENCKGFLDICKRLRKAGLHAPRVFQHNLQKGFIMLEDLGDGLYRDELDRLEPQALFDDSFDALATMAKNVDATGLPKYDEDTLYNEMNLFTDLYLVRHLGFCLTHRQRLAWMRFCEELVQAALEQPQVFVHKDFHSNNLLKTEDNSPGIIDFQDAVSGPISHDFVSLIWDRYVAWPRPQLEQWMEQVRLILAPEITSDQWVYYCDLMGLQRNLRIVGRFAQLKYSERKQGYIEMIPRFHQYILDVLHLYPQFADVEKWIGSDECAP